MIRPIRAHSIELSAGADTEADLIATLKQIIWDIQRGSRQCTSGSPSAGYYFTYIVNPEMTHERYIEELNATLEAKEL